VQRGVGDAPRWYPPALGAWAGVSVLATTLDEVVLRVAAAAVLGLVVVALVAAVRAPARSRPTGVVAAYGGAVLVVAVGSWFLAREVHPAAGAVAASALMTGLATASERVSPARPSRA
jgi:NhaP-type Na+/H+ or K+/H+ antiporter